MSEETATGWERLGEYVVARRMALGYRRQADLGAAAGVTSRVIGDIELGRRGNFSHGTVVGLEQALGWESGSMRRVMLGEEPTLAEAPVRAGDRCLMSPGCRHFGLCRLAAVLEAGA
jgi:hypothetical protein